MGGPAAAPIRTMRDLTTTFSGTRGRADGERYAELRKGEKVRQYTGTYGPDMFTDFILDFIKRSAMRRSLCIFP